KHSALPKFPYPLQIPRPSTHRCKNPKPRGGLEPFSAYPRPYSKYHLRCASTERVASAHRFSFFYFRSYFQDRVLKYLLVKQHFYLWAISGSCLPLIHLLRRDLKQLFLLRKDRILLLI